jgi:hypothetical protein
VDCQDWRTATTTNKGHGRLEIRELTATTELNEFLAGKWVGVAQVFRLVRTVHEKGKTRQEVIYGITSLSPSQANAEKLLELIRAHWSIEIVQSQMTKTNRLTLGREGDHVADLHLFSRDHDAVD